MLMAVLRGLLLTAIYLVLAGQVSGDEIGLAFACGLIALGWSLTIRHAARLRFRFSPEMLTMTAGALADVPRAIIAVAPALLLPRRGSIRREPAARGGANGADAGRRAITLLAISLAPDRFALRWAKRGDAVEIHHLSIGAPTGKPS